MLYFTGDTHHNIDVEKIRNFNPQTENNKLIVLGDWGGLWYNDYRKNYPLLKKWCKWQEEKNFKLLVILGNHENYRVINSLPKIEIKDENNHIKAKLLKVINPFKKTIKCEILILENGFQLIDGKRVFVVRGAASIDKEYRVENIDWWKEEELSEKEKEEIIRELERNNKYDYILTHTAPAFVVEKMIKELNVNPKKLDLVSLFLEEIYDKYLKDNFKFWLFGHFHINWQYENFICLYNKIISERDLNV